MIGDGDGASNFWNLNDGRQLGELRLCQGEVGGGEVDFVGGEFPDRLDAAVGALTAAVASAEADRSAIQCRARDLEVRARRLAARAAAGLSIPNFERISERRADA